VALVTEHGVRDLSFLEGLGRGVDGRLEPRAGTLETHPAVVAAAARGRLVLGEFARDPSEVLAAGDAGPGALNQGLGRQILLLPLGLGRCDGAFGERGGAVRLDEAQSNLCWELGEAVDEAGALLVELFP